MTAAAVDVKPVVLRCACGATEPTRSRADRKVFYDDHRNHDAVAIMDDPKFEYCVEVYVGPAEVAWAMQGCNGRWIVHYTSPFGEQLRLPVGSRTRTDTVLLMLAGAYAEGRAHA